MSDGVVSAAGWTAKNIRGAMRRLSESRSSPVAADVKTPAAPRAISGNLSRSPAINGATSSGRDRTAASAAERPRTGNLILVREADELSIDLRHTSSLTLKNASRPP